MLLPCKFCIFSAHGLFITTFENFLSTHLFADVISVHNGNMKHARAIEFDYTNLLATLKTLLPASILLQFNFYATGMQQEMILFVSILISLFERDITTRGFSPKIMAASLFSHEQLIRIIVQRSGTKNSWSGNNNIV